MSEHTSNMGQWHDAILDAVRRNTYDMLAHDYIAADPTMYSLEPDDFITEHRLEGRANINPADFPAGTWFCYPRWREKGECFVLEVSE